MLSSDLNIMIDKDGVNRKLKLLPLVLSQNKIDVKEIKYIDLRFQEPLIGKKEK